jgi:ubiquinone/menaquinone biosynthesis C-methylase UbiE
VAATTGARYLGVDIAVAGLTEVKRRAERLGLSGRVGAAEGSFESLPLSDGQADAAMSIDALLFSPDNAAAARELARVLRSGGRLVITSWDYHRQAEGRPPQVADHRVLLTGSGRLNAVPRRRCLGVRRAPRPRRRFTGAGEG